MGEDDIRQHFARQGGLPKPSATQPRMVARRPPRREAPKTFKDFSATHLMCPRCKKAMPVRERVLLFLPDGDLYDYSCTQCGTSVGTRKAER